MTAVAHTERAHSVLSPSKAHRWSRCPGSALAEAEYPDTPAGPESQWGTACHELAETSFQLGYPATHERFHQWKASNGVAWTLEMGETAEVYRLYLITHKPVGQLWNVEGRQNFPLIHPECFGTADALMVVPFDYVEVVDLKGGRGIIVEAVENEQLVIYASNALEADPAEARLKIIQPRTTDGKPIKEWVISGDELKTRIQALSVAAHEAMRPNARRAAGDHCKWCKAAKDCPEMRKQALATAQLDFDELPAVSTPASVPTHPAQLTPVQVTNALRLLPVLEAWIDTLRADAMGRAKRGELPGYKIVEGKPGNRAWSDKTAVAATLDNFGADPWEKVLISPADAEKALVAAILKTDGGLKKDATAKAKKVLDDLVSRASGKPNLVPESDPRPALALSAADDFSELPND